MEKEQTFSKTTFLQSGFFNFGSFWLILAKIENPLWRKVVLLKVWSFSIVFHIPKEK